MQNEAYLQIPCLSIAQAASGHTVPLVGSLAKRSLKTVSSWFMALKGDYLFVLKFRESWSYCLPQLPCLKAVGMRERYTATCAVKLGLHPSGCYQ